MPVRPALKTLLALVIGLPVLYCVLVGVASLLISMGDAAGAGIVARIQLGCLVLWAVCLVGTVIATAIAVLQNGPMDDADP
jgi:hypothetical protein